MCVKNDVLLDIGKRLAQVRKERGYTQDKLGELTGLSEKTISAAENGHKALRPENIIKICDCLSITADYLLYGDSPLLSSMVEYKEITQLTSKQRAALSKIIEDFLSAFEE